VKSITCNHDQLIMGRTDKINSIRSNGFCLRLWLCQGLRTWVGCGLSFCM